ncbi:MAG: tetratricopeptide repeat protein [Firmicutes bacterium]|nr:tetratricopeptide repeat protein [Bacillota bacterium]
MKDLHKPLSKDDYEEPSCLLIDEADGRPCSVQPVPQQRIIEKMDEYMSRRDYAGAERHLLYWLEEARMGNDERGELMVRNELIGHYRKVGDQDKAFAQADEAMRLIRRLDYDGTISSGTTYTNMATMYHVFGEHERALQLFEKARRIYEESPMTSSALLGGLYNNMALVSVSLGRFEEAHRLYDKAMEVMGKVPNGQLEQAITCLNRADAIEEELGEEGEVRIFALLDQALDMLDSPSIPHDGYYAFVCEKCYPSFEFYGYFMDAERLKDIAESIYRANREEIDS